MKILKLLVLICVMLSPLSANADEQAPKKSLVTNNPGTELWREVRQRDAPSQGITQVKGVDAGVLINPRGDQWARFRVNQLATYSPYVLGAVLLVILVFYLIRGRIRVEGGFSGDKIRRFTGFQRIAHWIMASLFIFLGLTGLILLLGRDFLIPLLGRDVFSVLAFVSKEGHNLLGVLFLVSLLMMLFLLVKRNLYEKGDLKWLATAGGTIGKSHPSIGFFNAGEKCLFWLVVLLGLVISVSGLILVTPNFGQGRVLMELSHITHTISAIALIAATFGHMYLGSLGMEGAFDAMKTGYVDANWAEAHHDRWAKECREKGLIISAEEYARLQGERSDGGATSSSATAGQTS